MSLLLDSFFRELTTVPLVTHEEVQFALLRQTVHRA
jgi:hypothetical protein